MFCINNLNENILARILGYVVRVPIKDMTEWKTRLQYLHVCSMWSDMLVSFVMSHGFISVYDSKADVSCTPEGRSKIVCYSNTHIIIDRRYQGFTTRLDISSRACIGFQDFFDIVFEHLKPDIYEWPAVTLLGIYLVSSYAVVVDKHNFVTPPDSDSAYQSCTNTIYGCMPNVKKLIIKEPNEDVGTFTHILINRYAHQLVHINSPNPISLSLPQFCSNLAHLKLKLDPNRKPLYLPCLRAAPLKYLDLFNIPPEFSWAEFYDANSHNIVFENLETLCLMYTVPSLVYRTTKTSGNEVASIKQQRFVYYRLHFPKLTTLRVYNCPSPSELLFCQQYFDTVPNVFIGGIMASVARAIDMGLKRQDELKVHISELLPDQHDMFHNTTNYLFGGGNYSSSSQLVIGADLNTVDISLIRWPHLASLCICETINVDIFYRLISTLPNLTIAIAFRLYIDNDALGLDAQRIFSTDTDNLEDYSKALDTLFCMFPTGTTFIKEMALYFDKDSPGTTAVKACIAICLALSSLSINKLAVDPQFQSVYAILGQEMMRRQLPQSSIDVEYEDNAVFMATFWHMFYLI